MTNMTQVLQDNSQEIKVEMQDTNLAMIGAITKDHLIGIGRSFLMDLELDRQTRKKMSKDKTNNSC